MTNDEIWKEIVEYEGLYSISNWGRVYSHTRFASDGKWIQGRYRKFGKTRGYCYVPLSKNGEAVNHLIHRLVAMAFIPNPHNKKAVNHKDGNKLNNRLENLEWVTAKENMIHASANGLIGRETLITFNSVTMRLGDWAKELGVKRSTISGRLNRSGMTIEEALTPNRPKQNRKKTERLSLLPNTDLVKVDENIGVGKKLPFYRKQLIQFLRKVGKPLERYEIIHRTGIPKEYVMNLLKGDDFVSISRGVWTLTELLEEESNEKA